MSDLFSRIRDAGRRFETRRRIGLRVLFVLGFATSLGAQSQFATYDPTGNLTQQATSASAVGPTIVTPPQGLLSPVGGGAVSFNMVATGSAPLSYAWMLNGTPISTTTSPSAATDTLVLTNLATGSFQTGNVDNL